MSIQRTLFLVSYCTYLLANGALAITKCGFPGKPTNGNISPEKAIYSENQTVTYSCPGAFNMLYGTVGKRTCSPNGSWTETLPHCVPNIVYQRETITVYPSSGDVSQNKYLVDHRISTCLELQPVGKIRWVRIGLERKLGVRIIWLFSQNNTEFSVKASVIDTFTNKSTLCGSHEGDHKGSWIRIDCPAPEYKEGFPGGTPGDTILIEELYAGNKPLFFCDIQASAYYGNTDCGLAEAPAFGSAEYVGPKRVEYKCQPGFTLIGPSYRYCDPDGAWTHWPRNTTAPTCKLEKWQESFNVGRNCVNLESHIPNARIYYELRRSVAIIECKDGFELIADQVLLCISFGVWLGYAEHGLHCKRRTVCGSTENKCQSGFTLIGPRYQYCDPDGTWIHWPRNTTPTYCFNLESHIANARIYYEFHRTVAIVECKDGYELIADQVLLCTSFGEWLGFAAHGLHCKSKITELTGTSSCDNLTEYLEYISSTIRNLEFAREISWKTAFIGTVTWACISTMFSILACCYFCTRQQRRETGNMTGDIMQLQSRLGKDKRTGNGYVSHANKGEIPNYPLSNNLDENRISNIYDEIVAY